MAYPRCFRTPPGEVLRRAAGIRLLGLDVDGVLTDGTLWYGAEGETLKPFNILDGLGIRLLLEAGIAVAVISARHSAALRRRVQDLGIPHVHTGAGDKVAVWERLLRDQGLSSEQAAYMGDDLIDLPVLRNAGLAITVPNGHPLLARICHWRTERAGGAGAVREACELILDAKGLLDMVFERYLHD